MSQDAHRRLVLLIALGCALFLAFAATRVAHALPPAGIQTVDVTGQVNITSRTGQETIALGGTATIQLAAPHSKGSVDANDAEVTALNLTGNSVTGPVTITESPSQVSNGELRSMSDGSLPATSFFNIYAIVTVPASPNPTITLHNDIPLVFNNASVAYWPLYNATYVASPSPCVLLEPSFYNPAQICITGGTMTLSAPGVGGFTELPVSLERSERVKNTRPEDHLGGIGVLLVLFVTFGVLANFARVRVRPRR